MMEKVPFLNFHNETVPSTLLPTVLFFHKLLSSQKTLQTWQKKTTHFMRLNEITTYSQTPVINMLYVRLSHCQCYNPFIQLRANPTVLYTQTSSACEKQRLDYFKISIPQNNMMCLCYVLCASNSFLRSKKKILKSSHV